MTMLRAVLVSAAQHGSKKNNAAHRNVFSLWVATEETTTLYFLTSFA